MSRISDAPTSRAIPVGPWTHDALRSPQAWSYPLKEEAPVFDETGFNVTGREFLIEWGDRSVPHTAHVPYFSPEHGEGWTASQIRKVDIARWIFGIRGSFSFMAGPNPLIQSERDREMAAAEDAYAKLAEFDWLGLDFELAPEGTTVTGRKGLTRRRLKLMSELREVMAEVLGRKQGEVVPDPRVYATFVSRRIEVGGLRVCEACQIIFATRVNRPASVCRTCRRHPPRYRYFPLVEGGWHTGARLGPPAHRFVNGRAGQPRKAFYTAICSSCERHFESNDARRHLCRNCGGPAGRVRRRRGGSPLGRQLYRFAGEGAAVSVGIRRADGSQGTISSNVHGMIETDDAEIASQLEGNNALRRID